MNTSPDVIALAEAPVSPPAPQSRADFHRRLVCILGLPFDVITLDEAVQRIRHDAFSSKRCFVSTPNLNFAIAARTDADFRGAVLRSDLSLVDGMPLVWIARLLGLPVPMRVAGADLFEALSAHAGPAILVYLFGGPPGAAMAASERINGARGGVRCVGFESPGTGSVESMSSADQIERINRSGAHFVVVALGAKKGQAWIEANAPRLHAPVLSHLGAVINFAAGSVQRAPRWMQRGGLEWLWRIREEPALWRRYGHDGWVVLRLGLTSVLAEFVSRRVRSAGNLVAPAVELRRTEAGNVVICRGPWGHDENGLPALARAFDECAEHGDGAGTGAGVAVDLSEVTESGNSLAAMLLVGSGWFAPRGGFRVGGARGAVAAALRRNGVVLDA